MQPHSSAIGGVLPAAHAWAAVTSLNDETAFAGEAHKRWLDDGAPIRRGGYRLMETSAVSLLHPRCAPTKAGCPAAQSIAWAVAIKAETNTCTRLDCCDGSLGVRRVLMPATHLLEPRMRCSRLHDRDALQQAGTALC